MSRISQERPFLRLPISAADPTDTERLLTALVEIAGQVPPKVHITTQPRDGLCSLDGTAESGLDLICDRLRDEYSLAIKVESPQAILIETIRKQAEGEGKYIRQTGGSGNYGHCWLRIEPSEAGKGYEFVNEIKGDVVPEEYIKPVDQGVQEALELGILAGFPMVDVKVTLFDGSYHDVDSNELAFKFAGSIAFSEAAKKANPVILEPIMSLEVELFEGPVSAVRDEILAHRGRIVRDDITENGLCEFKALIPLSELLASASGKLAEFPMEFAGYEPVRESDLPDDGTAGVTVKRPNNPRLGGSSEATRWDREGV